MGRVAKRKPGLLQEQETPPRVGLPPFPADAINLPADELGGLLFGYYIAAQASECGIPANAIPEDFAERVRQKALALDEASARNAALEKALRKAAEGDFAAAGNLFRDHMLRGAGDLKLIPIGIARLTQAAHFGRKGAKVSRAEGERNRQTIMGAAERIRANWHGARPMSQNDLAGRIARDTGINESTVRGHLTRQRKVKKTD